MVRDCPKCGLVNPPETRLCDCGFDFATGEVNQFYLPGPRARTAGIGIGGVIVVFIVIRLMMRLMSP